MYVYESVHVFAYLREPLALVVHSEFRTILLFLYDGCNGRWNIDDCNHRCLQILLSTFWNCFYPSLPHLLSSSYSHLLVISNFTPTPTHPFSETLVVTSQTVPSSSPALFACIAIQCYSLVYACNFHDINLDLVDSVPSTARPRGSMDLLSWTSRRGHGSRTVPWTCDGTREKKKMGTAKYGFVRVKKSAYILGRRTGVYHVVLINNSRLLCLCCCLYYKRGDHYLCSANAPVLEGSGSRRLYRRKGTSVDRVYVVFGARVDLGFVTISQKRIRGGVRSLKVTARHSNNAGSSYECPPLSQCHASLGATQ